MYIYLLDNSLRVKIFYDQNDSDFDDNLCISIDEECPDDEKIFRHDETNIYITLEEACQLVQTLQKAIEKSRAGNCPG